MTFDCEVNAAHDLVLHLPATVTPGRHRISLVIDPPDQATTESAITPIPEDVPPRTALWSQLARLRGQAEKEGLLPEPLSWEAVLTEVERRRGEGND